MSRFLKFIVHFIVICTVLCVVALVAPPFWGITTVIVDNTEKKYKKRELLDSSFAICLKPFLEYTEPNSGEDAEITFIHNDGETTLPYNEREGMYAHFSNNGKRLYDDGMFDLIVVNNGHESLRLTHVTGIEFK